VVAIPEFRRTGQEGGGWPGTFDDVTAALEAVPNLLAPYSEDPPVLLGHSAGGHLAVWAAVHLSSPSVGSPSPLNASHPNGPRSDMSHPDAGGARLDVSHPVARIRAVVSLAGCVDLAMCSALGLDDGATDLLLGGPPSAVPDRYALADPAQRPAPAVPVTLLHGTADDRVPIEVSRSYAARTGVPLQELPDTGHFALIDPLTPAWPHVLAALSQR
jgi:pimeloyl-ACP methyl ester carboxylesterase